MFLFVLRRLMGGLPTLLLVTVLVFTLTRVLPGDPARLLLGEEATPELVAQIREELGLNRPILVQYADWLWGLVRGDLGRSIRGNEPVAPIIWQKLPTTLELSLFSLLVAVAIGIPAGVLAALRRNSAIDAGVTVMALSGVSIPNFFLGILLIYVFSIRLAWIPPSGYVEPWVDLQKNLLLMLMPAITLGTALAGAIARFTRNSMLEVLSQDYVRTARAKGLEGRVVVYKHALRNAAIPVVTVIGLQLGGLLGGAVVTEQVFSIPGFGRLLVDSVFNRDFPVLQAVVLISALAVFLINVLTDLLYAAIDPRIRYH
ncbi:ABC transporter permease [Meiothermus ruber]|uniref:Binding-protein-dependent transport system inner membrane protein n=1 Tax=Meiothermus ruber (strain ATCC 35948 / DSM 1279 / VKM B-1258 / 21) TaxID=504728 RepID=D3PRX3_MEIRD|nr:ABC transporter permease [Meiothermus ruber]ADD28206.1 binding-protein-dependent transport systems inner membrane component [Meiothermus ruber DSM 1279]AGK06356.1 binding-protein-dependent transport system inner membrane protein [Meiothermus ruber DSM 1279]MCL6528919.1 ABC transporter permease [Meiothermus ruber]GAO75147.1 binding-protein-dependent transport system inner membrane protein [Meiothermus ruber H328]